MMVFQESMLEWELQEYCMTEDSAPDMVMVPIHYAAVLVGEYLETIDGLKEEVIHNDLMVGMTSIPLLDEADCLSHSTVKSSWINSCRMNWGRRSMKSSVLMCGGWRTSIFLTNGSLRRLMSRWQHWRLSW